MNAGVTGYWYTCITLVVQGWKVLDPDALAARDVPDHETAVGIPRALLDVSSQRIAGVRVA